MKCIYRQNWYGDGNDQKQQDASLNCNVIFGIPVLKLDIRGFPSFTTIIFSFPLCIVDVVFILNYEIRDCEIYSIKW